MLYILIRAFSFNIIGRRKLFGFGVLIKRFYQLVMNSNHNPLRHIQDMTIRHLIMQILAWMWCIIFAMSIGSITVFGVSAVAHALLIAGIFITLGTFETAKRKPQFFGGLGRGSGGEHE